MSGPRTRRRGLYDIPIRRLRTAAPLAAVAVLAVVLLVVLATCGRADSTANVAAPAPSSTPAAPVDTQTVAPSDAETGVAPPDGPAPDVGPYGIDGQALLDEVRSHDVALGDADGPKLVQVGERAVARGQADLTADDQAIGQDVRATFPGWSDQQYADVIRCVAEYAERVKARNDGTVPPDSDDHEGR